MSKEYDDYASALLAVGIDGTATIMGYINNPAPVVIEVIEKSANIILKGWDRKYAGIIDITIVVSSDSNNDYFAFIDEFEQVCTCNDLVSLYIEERKNEIGGKDED